MEKIMRLHKGRHLSPKRAERIISGAGQILQHVGVKVTDKTVLEELHGFDGIQMKEDRVYVGESVYRGFLERQKAYKTVLDKHGDRLHGEASLYTYHYRDAVDGQIKIFNQKTLGEYAAFVEKAHRVYPLNPVIPGYPTDVPAQLSSLARYKISAENCSSSWPVAPDSVEAAKYMFEMTEVMGQEMKHLPVYMISPLTLGGDAFDIVRKNCHRLESFYTFAMPNMGVTTPMNLSMGLALVLAEVAGGAILTEMLTGLKGEIRPNLFPFDFKQFNIAFGTPEKFLYEQAAVELAAYIRDGEPDYSSTNIHTWGKEPDGRTAMEKGMMIMAGAMGGARRFYCVGTESLDELFDPLQMIQDLEAIVFAQKILDGVPKDDVEDTLLAEIEEGLMGGFVSSDRSLDDFEDYFTSSQFSCMDNLQKWVLDGEKSTGDSLKEIYQEIEKQPVEYVLDGIKKRELDKIFEIALKHQV